MREQSVLPLLVFSDSGDLGSELDQAEHSSHAWHWDDAASTPVSQLPRTEAATSFAHHSFCQNAGFRVSETKSRILMKSPSTLSMLQMATH